MAKKKKSKLWAGVKWAAVIGTGAVIGAYTVRFVDRRFAPMGGPQPNPDEAIGPSGGEEYAVGDMPSSNPMAIQAISPLMPVAVPIPPMVAMPMVPQIPAMPAMPQMSPGYGGHAYGQEGHAYAQETPEVKPGPSRETAAEARARKKSDYEKIVTMFENGELD